MANPVRWRPTRTNLVAGTMVIAGLGFTNLSWWFLLLAALGTFGPGILREIGLLRDKDEFQRRAEHRAGYRAFLTTGLVAFLLVAFFRSGDRTIQNPGEIATLFLALLWFSWFLSALLSYWGPQKAAARILLGFGFAWLAFTIASNVGSEWTGWAALLLHPLLVLPFFALAWLSPTAARPSPTACSPKSRNSERNPPRPPNKAKPLAPRSWNRESKPSKNRSTVKSSKVPPSPTS